MITKTLLIIILSVIRVILLPITNLNDVTLPSGITDAITTAGGYFHNVDKFLPLSTLFAILSLYLVIELAIAIYKFVKWGYQKIPGLK